MYQLKLPESKDIYQFGNGDENMEKCVELATEALLSQTNSSPMAIITGISDPLIGNYLIIGRLESAIVWHFYEFYLPHHWDEITEKNVYAHFCVHFQHFIDMEIRNSDRIDQYQTQIQGKEDRFLTNILTPKLVIRTMATVQYYRSTIDFLLNTKDADRLKALFMLTYVEEDLEKTACLYNLNRCDEFDEFISEISQKYLFLIYQRMIPHYDDRMNNLMMKLNYYLHSFRSTEHKVALIW